MNVLDPLGSSAAGARRLAPRPSSLRGVAAALALVVVVCAPPVTVSADSTGPSPAPAAPRPAAPSAEQEYNRGLRARAAKDWTAAVGAFRKAVEMRPAFAEAWNELGYALRNQGRYEESVRAYDEALRLRPRFPEALEYLGEAYVKMGRLDEARRIHDRLKPLDAARAQELAEVIARGR